MDIFRISARAMAMDGAALVRHANPASVVSRFAVLPPLSVAAAVFVRALWRVDFGRTLAGLALATGGKAWCVVRMVWRYEYRRGGGSV